MTKWCSSNEVLSHKYVYDFTGEYHKTSNGNFSFKGNDLYSYATQIATIDREKKSYLFGVYYLRDFFNETVFVFIWNNKHYTVQFLSRYDEDDTLIWDVPENYARKSFVFPYNTEEGFIDDLRSALIAYGNSGTPRENGRKNLVKCNF